MVALFFGIEEQVIITFLFVLAIVFGVLRISNVLKSGPASFLLSLALAAFAAWNLSATLWIYMPSLTWFFIIVFLIAFVFEMFGLRKGGEKPSSEGMVVNAAVLLIMLSVGWRIAQTFKVTLPFIGGTENLVFLAGLVFIIAIFWGAMKGGWEVPGGK